MPARKSKKYAENPFIKELVEDSQPTIKKISSPFKSDDMMLVNRITGEVPTNSQIGLIFTKTVEANEFVKLYTKGVSAMFGLNRPGQKVFTILFDELSGKEGMERDTVDLFYPNFSPEVKKALSYRTFLNGVNNLIKNGFIAESTMPFRFFVNPNFLYNGDRLAIITMYKKKGAGETPHREYKVDANGTMFEEQALLSEPEQED